MERTKKFVGSFYWIGFFTLIFYGVILIFFLEKSLEDTIHAIAYWLPSIAMLAVISGQIDLLSSMQKNGVVNLKARSYDFIHWLMLVALNISAVMLGAVNLSWFFLKLLTISIIGWQIGVGIAKNLDLSMSEKKSGIMFACFAFLLGLCTGYIRFLDQTDFGWGWWLETITSVIGTSIVLKWIVLDIKTMRGKGTSGYPRSFFMKGLFNNSLVLIFWTHVMAQGGFDSFFWWHRNFALTFNILIGNILYLGYWLTYEYERRAQRR